MAPSVREALWLPFFMGAGNAIPAPQFTDGETKPHKGEAEFLSQAVAGPAVLSPLPVMGPLVTVVSRRPPRDLVTQAPKETLSKQGLVSGEHCGSLVPAGPGKQGGWGLQPPNPSSGLE